MMRRMLKWQQITIRRLTMPVAIMGPADGLDYEDFCRIIKSRWQAAVFDLNNNAKNVGFQMRP